MRTERHMAEIGSGDTVSRMTTLTTARTLALVGLLFGATACSNSSGSSVQPLEFEGATTIEGESGSAPVNEDENMRPITLLVDGWSVAGIADGSLQWSREMNGTREPVVLTPANADTLREIAALDPAAIVQVAARIVSGAPDLSCDTDGCRGGGEDISFEMLASPQTGGPFAEMYRTWGITSGVWVAQLQSRQAYVWYGASQLAVTQTLPGAEVEETLGVVDSGVRPVGVAFGTVFRIQAEWLGGKFGYGVRTFESIAAESLVGPQQVRADAFLRGLSSSVVGAGSLGAGQLTWRSSPTTGCGVGVVCVPGLVEASVEATPVQRYNVCKDDLRGVMELGAVDVRFTYPNPTHQYGIWGSERPTGLIAGNPAIWVSTPPFVNGSVAQHHTYAHLYDTVGLHEKTGRISTIGVDDETETSAIPGETDITKVFGGGWVKC